MSSKAIELLLLWYLCSTTRGVNEEDGARDEQDILMKQLVHVIKEIAEIQQYADEIERNITRLRNSSDVHASQLPENPPQHVPAYSCQELYAKGSTESGVYQIQLFHGMRSIFIDCDMDTVGEYSAERGWITIQRRLSGKVNFDRGWDDYVNGFGFPDGEHWIGLQNIYDLLRQGVVHSLDDPGMKLRMEAMDWDGNSAFVEYDDFDLFSEELDFKMRRVGGYRGTEEMGDPLTFNLGKRFSTKDHSNEPMKSKTCEMTGGWWFRKCRHTNFNGRYTTEGQPMTKETIFLSTWQDVNPKNTALRYVSMKLQ